MRAGLHHGQPQEIVCPLQAGHCSTSHPEWWNCPAVAPQLWQGSLIVQR